MVYLIDGEKLVDVCKRYQIGVKKVELPGLLVLDPEVTREAELSGYKTNTVRVYLYDDQRRRKVLGDAIRGDQKTHSRALALVAGRRETEPPE